MYLSIRDEILFAAGYPTLTEGLNDLQIKAVELWVRRDETVSALKPDGSKTRFNLSDYIEMAMLQDEIEAENISVTALCMGNNFNAEDKAAEWDWAIRTVEAARQLGAHVVRIDAMMHGEQELALEARQEIVAEAIRHILEETQGSGVDLGIENHGVQGNDPAFLHGLLDRVGSPRLGLTLDSGNFYWRGWPLAKVYEIFAEFASVVKHTHIKNIAYPPEMREMQREVGYAYEKYVCPIHEGDIDHACYFAILRAAGYDRDLCLEDESLGKYLPEQRQANLRAAADFFRAQIGSASRMNLSYASSAFGTRKTAAEGRL